MNAGHALMLAALFGVLLGATALRAIQAISAGGGW